MLPNPTLVNEVITKYNDATKQMLKQCQICVLTNNTNSPWRRGTQWTDPTKILKLQIRVHGLKPKITVHIKAQVRGDEYVQQHVKNYPSNSRERLDLWQPYSPRQNQTID